MKCRGAEYKRKKRTRKLGPQLLPLHSESGPDSLSDGNRIESEETCATRFRENRRANQESQKNNGVRNRDVRKEIGSGKRGGPSEEKRRLIKEITSGARDGRRWEEGVG